MIDKIALTLAIIGGLNWGSIALFSFDLVAFLFGGQTSADEPHLFMVWSALPRCGALRCCSAATQRPRPNGAHPDRLRAKAAGIVPGACFYAICVGGKIRTRCVCDIAGNLFDLDADLLHGVAVTHGHAAVLLGFKVDRDAVRRADLVLAAVALANRAGVVKVDRELLGQRPPRSAWPCRSAFWTAAAPQP